MGTRNKLDVNNLGDGKIVVVDKAAERAKRMTLPYEIQVKRLNESMEYYTSKIDEERDKIETAQHMIGHYEKMMIRISEKQTALEKEHGEKR